MDCPFCGNFDSKVIDSRDVNDGIRRRRECLKCTSRFTTYERLESANLYVIKKDQRREAFNKEKLLGGIRKACEKRPLPIGAVDRLADDIEAELYRKGKSEISSVMVGDMVMEKLKKLDYIAYIRFASVYRDFTDITALKREIDTLVGDDEEDADEAVPAAQLPLLPAEEPLPTAKNRQRSRR